MTKLKIIIIIFLAVMLFFYAGLQATVILYPSFASVQKADAAMVLGYALKDGLVPDSWSESRLQKGIDLYKSGYVKKIVISGGQGSKDKIPVSVAMKKWIVDKGIPESDVLTEEKAHSTVENFELSKNIFETNGFENIIVVTNEFHYFRSYLIASNIIPEQFSVAPASTSLNAKKVIAYLKEPIAILRYWILKQ